jgi:C4-dicarboxylate-specific signal transduction histidine kinase
VTNQDTRDASLNLILGLEAVESTQPVEDFLHFIHPEDRDMVDEEIQRTIRERRTYVAEFRIIRPDGTVRWLRDQGKPLCDENDRVLCLTGAVIDITDLKQAQERLNEYREKMARAEQLVSLGTVGATVAHELTQPLTVIRLSIENSLMDLDTKSCPSAVTEGLKDSLAEVSHAVSIINRLRNFARKSSKRDVAQVNLKAVADRVTQLLDAQAWRAKVTVSLKNMDKLPPVLMNERDLDQLFFSLVENAVQAAGGRKDRQLIISGDVKDEHIELQFSDDCGGIARKNLDKIFEPFFTTRPAGEGTGLGLCIVQRIVSQAGGKVRIESKAGKGSTFFITLPINKSRKVRLNGDGR